MKILRILYEDTLQSYWDKNLKKAEITDYKSGHINVELNNKNMENLNFINPLLHGIIPDELDQNTRNISTKQLVCAGIGTLIAGVVLKKVGYQKTATLVSGLALPLLASALYKKFASCDKSSSEDDIFYDNDERGHA